MTNKEFGCDNKHARLYGRCDRDLKVYFKNKIGSTCSIWLSYTGWWDGAEPFGMNNKEYCFNWDSADCVGKNGFEVPNKVKVV